MFLMLLTLASNVNIFVYIFKQSTALTNLPQNKKVYSAEDQRKKTKKKKKNYKVRHARNHLALKP